MILIGTTSELVISLSLSLSLAISLQRMKNFFFLQYPLFMQHLWQGKCTWGEVLALVLSGESMVEAREMAVAHHTSAKAAVVLPVTSSSSWRQWTLLRLTPKGNITSFKIKTFSLYIFLWKRGWWLQTLFVCCLSEEEESLPVVNGIWTRLLDVLQLKFEDLNLVFSSSTTFETQCSVFSPLSFTLKNHYQYHLLKTCSHNVQNLLSFFVGSLNI